MKQPAMIREVRVEKKNRAGQRKRDAQAGRGAAQNGPASQPIVGAGQPLPVFRSETETSGTVVVAGLLSRRQLGGNEIFVDSVRSRREFAGERIDGALNDIGWARIPA